MISSHNHKPRLIKTNLSITNMYTCHPKKLTPNKLFYVFQKKKYTPGASTNPLSPQIPPKPVKLFTIITPKQVSHPTLKLVNIS
jgi:hypothetical protein